jgi:hypothetical protein
MTVAHAIQLTELLSIMLIVFGFALRSSVRDVTSLFRNPSLLLRSLLAMNVLLPLFAASMGAVLALRPAIVIALVALAMQKHDIIGAAIQSSSSSMRTSRALRRACGAGSITPMCRRPSKSTVSTRPPVRPARRGRQITPKIEGAYRNPITIELLLELVQGLVAYIQLTCWN